MDNSISEKNRYRASLSAGPFTPEKTQGEGLAGDRSATFQSRHPEKDAGGGVAATLTRDQLQRYSRQILLSGVGEEGQLKLLRSKVLLVGAGGLGSPIALYLAAGGVGTLGIVDDDRVDLSNIHRQVLHGTDDVGKRKAVSAREALLRANPEVTIHAHARRFSGDNAMELVRAYDVVVDGADNFETKFLINDAAFFAGKPYVYGGAVRFDGQASLFFPKEGGPCLRCMFPEIPPPGTSPLSSEVGVLGIVPGQIGLIQAGEVLKFLLGIGSRLMGRFLVYNFLRADFSTFTVEPNPRCPLCGQNPTITGISVRQSQPVPHPPISR